MAQGVDALGVIIVGMGAITIPAITRTGIDSFFCGNYCTTSSNSIEICQESIMFACSYAFYFYICVKSPFFETCIREPDHHCSSSYYHQENPSLFFRPSLEGTSSSSSSSGSSNSTVHYTYNALKTVVKLLFCFWLCMYASIITGGEVCSDW